MSGNGGGSRGMMASASARREGLNGRDGAPRYFGDGTQLVALCYRLQDASIKTHWTPRWTTHYDSLKGRCLTRLLAR